MPTDGRCAAMAFSMGLTGMQNFGPELLSLAADAIAKYEYFTEFDVARGLSPAELKRRLLTGEEWGDHIYLTIWSALTGLGVVVYDVREMENLAALEVTVVKLPHPLFANAEDVRLIRFHQHYYVLGDAATTWPFWRAARGRRWRTWRSRGRSPLRCQRDHPLSW